MEQAMSKNVGEDNKLKDIGDTSKSTDVPDVLTFPEYPAPHIIGQKDRNIAFVSRKGEEMVKQNGLATREMGERCKAANFATSEHGVIDGMSVNNSTADKEPSDQVVSEEKEEQWKSVVMCIIIGFIDVVIAILIILVVHYKNQDENLRNEMSSWSGHNQHVTIPCDDVSLSWDEDKETFSNERNKFELYVDSENRNICRFSNITDVIEKMTERQARLRLAKGQLPPQPISCGNKEMARKSGDLTAIFTRLSPHQNFSAKRNIWHTIHWDKHHERSTIAPGLKYHNGKIRVNETQFYFVYASLIFNLTTNEEQSGDRYGSFDDLAFRFYVLKSRVGYNGQYETRLMEYTQMLCDKPGAVGSGHVGSQLLLRPEEELYVRVSDPHRLVHDTRGNTFGLYPVS